jgi:hypothetical protein
MTRYDTTARRTTPRRVAGAAAVLVTAGLALTGCKSSASAAGSSSPAASSSSPAAGSSSPAASGGSSAATQATTFFPVGVDNTWVYTTQVAGKPTSDVTNKMIAVDPVADGQKVTMSVATGTLAPTTVTYIFHPDGSITVPTTQFANGALQLTAGSVTWPSQAQLATGQAVSSTLVFTVNVTGKVTHETAHVTVAGGGLQTVTVPAGTYQAQEINETFTENVGGLPAKLTLQTWVANGVGPVKTALLSTSAVASGPTSVEELKSFTKGQ